MSLCLSPSLSFLSPSLHSPLSLFQSLPLSLSSTSFLFSSFSYMFFHFFFFTDIIISCITKAGRGTVGRKKRKQFLPRKENVTTCYFRSSSSFLSSLLPQLILYAAFLSQNQSMYPGKHMSSKVGKGPISGISYLQKHFHICKETVSLQLNFLGAIW